MSPPVRCRRACAGPNPPTARLASSMRGAVGGIGVERLILHPIFLGSPAGICGEMRTLVREHRSQNVALSPVTEPGTRESAHQCRRERFRAFGFTPLAAA